MGKIVIVDFGMGNLFSVLQACRHVGIEAVISNSPKDILGASGIILPGVGAFGDAMANLNSAGLADPLKHVAQSGTPLLGICLGMQVLMSESLEFGHHRGLGIIEGDVVKLENHEANDKSFKVPHIGWDPIREYHPGQWKGSFLDGIPPGQDMYYVHSFYVRPKNNEVCLSYTEFGRQRFCSSLQSGFIWACQYHPERSARGGLEIYRHFANTIHPKMESSR